MSITHDINNHTTNNSAYIYIYIYINAYKQNKHFDERGGSKSTLQLLKRNVL